MPLSVLITQCLQRDFVEPVGPHETLPNKLHVGREEALRLVGADPDAGPVAQLMAWARQQDPAALRVVHVRDFHDPDDPRQRDHLATFGQHCLRGTPGAEFVLGLSPDELVVDSVALNDFEGTELPRVLDELRHASSDGALRVGVVGVWTEAKVSFLLYDLKTRSGIHDLGTCSALTASASRSQHFNALSQLTSILGVQSFDGVGEFTEWLLPSGTPVPMPARAPGFGPKLLVEPASLALVQPDQDILGFLYRGSARVELTALSGGFSGAHVFRTRSFDQLGHEQAPSVAKLGDRKLIGAERVAFENVEHILGNHAPKVLGFVDLGARAGIRYAYAGMGKGRVRSLQSLFESGAADADLERVLSTTIEEVLGPLYAAACYERLPLLDHYGFHRPELVDGVRRNVEDLEGPGTATWPALAFGRGRPLRNVCRFYEEFLPVAARSLAARSEFHFVSYVHGDLNGENVLLDARGNVWVIDFFHTGRGHVLKDLAKLENDLLYVFTPTRTDDEFEEGLAILEALRRVEDLAAPLPEGCEGVTSPHWRRAWRMLRVLRRLGAALCRSDRDPVQLSIALLRYAMHTTGFSEPTRVQRRLALAAACGWAERIEQATLRNVRLRVDWVDTGDVLRSGRLGLTLCPGRRDRGRALDVDLAALLEQGVTHVMCLATDQELEWAGVADLRAAVERHGLSFSHYPIRDQGVPSVDGGRGLVRRVLSVLDGGGALAVHCIGGLGRSGTIAACVLAARGLSAEEAITRVRRARGPRAVEVAEQARYVADFVLAD